MSRRCKTTGANHPNWSPKDGHIPSPWVVSYQFLHLLIIRDWQIYLYSDTSSCMCWSVTVAGWSHHHNLQRASITPSIRTPSEEGEPLGEPLAILGALCHWCHLPHPMTCWAWESLVLLTSPSDAPSSRSHIQSSMLQVPAKDQMALPDPRGPLAFIFFSMTASAIAWWAFGTVFTVASTSTVLPAQLTDPDKLNPMSLVLV